MHTCTRKQHKADSTCTIYQTGMLFFLCDPAMFCTCHWKHSQPRDDLPLRHVIMKFAPDMQRQADGRGRVYPCHSKMISVSESGEAGVNWGDGLRLLRCQSPQES